MEIADYLHRKEVLAAEKVLLCESLWPVERHMLFSAERRRNAIMTLACHGWGGGSWTVSKVVLEAFIVSLRNNCLKFVKFPHKFINFKINSFGFWIYYAMWKERGGYHFEGRFGWDALSCRVITSNFSYLTFVILFTHSGKMVFAKHFQPFTLLFSEEWKGTIWEKGGRAIWPY